MPNIHANRVRAHHVRGCLIHNHLHDDCMENTNNNTWSIGVYISEKMLAYFWTHQKSKTTYILVECL